MRSIQKPPGSVPPERQVSIIRVSPLADGCVRRRVACPVAPRAALDDLLVDLAIRAHKGAAKHDSRDYWPPHPLGTLERSPPRKDQVTLLRAGSLEPIKSERPAWETLLGPAGALRPYVIARPGERRQAEGWAHVMDKRRCTAVAVEGFAEAGQEAKLAVDAEGRLRIGRTFAPSDKREGQRPKRLSIWLHFVNMPVQVGAATSPQAMQAPLHVELQRE